MEIGEKALEKQLEIMGEQQKKAAEFVDKKVKAKCIPDVECATIAIPISLRVFETVNCKLCFLLCIDYIDGVNNKLN